VSSQAALVAFDGLEVGESQSHGPVREEPAGFLQGNVSRAQATKPPEDPWIALDEPRTPERGIEPEKRLGHAPEPVLRKRKEIDVHADLLAQLALALGEVNPSDRSRSEDHHEVVVVEGSRESVSEDDAPLAPGVPAEKQQGTQRASEPATNVAGHEG
jgi:hypothetical protein